jgi:RimJ/RimL family protein N-acetyltransferase
VFALYPDVKTVVSVPQQDNLASRRVLEKAGFTLVGERLLKTGDASDAGISAIYSYDRP